MTELGTFRRQYVAGPRPTKISGWRTVALGRGQLVVVHPELPCAEAGENGRKLICLGDMFSPDEPQADNHDVLRTLLDKFTDFECLERALAPLGGRWLLLVRMGTQLRAYPDAVGGRPIYHCSNAQGVWLGSMPAVLGHVLGLRVNLQANAEFARYRRGAWWPGTLTPYEDVKHSPPNHYLDLATGTAVRFWPRQPIAPVDVDTAAAEIRRLLLGILTAASHRYEVTVAVTGGYDSRVLIAVSKPVHDRIRFFTLAYPGIKPFDLTIPPQLATRCGLRYTRERYDAPSDEFLARFDELASSMISGQCRLNAQTYLRFPPKAAFAEGTGGEVLRCYFDPKKQNTVTASPTALAERSGFAGNPLAEAEFRRWLGGVPEAGSVFVWDLFYWEQKMGNWNATDYAAQELTRFVFTPFSCRQLLETGLGTPVSARREPYLLHRTVCQQAYPEVLHERFNFALSMTWQRFERSIKDKAKRVLGLD